MIKREKIAAVVAEFLGVVILATAVYAMVARTSFPFFGGLTAGLVLAAMVMVIGGVSGAHINPAVTVGLWSARKVRTSTAIVYVGAQMLGGLAAMALIKYFLGQPIESMAQGQFEWKLLIAEAVGAFILLFGIVASIYQKQERNTLAFVAGSMLTIGIFVASLVPNGGVLNPAVAVGIQSWSWAYAAGPIIGGIVGANLYSLLFAGDLTLNFSRPKTAKAKAAAQRSQVTTKKRTSKKKR